MGKAKSAPIIQTKTGDGSFKRIAFISDIHFAATMDDEHLFKEELIPYFITPLISYKPDLIVLGGDLTDKRISMNTTSAMFCNKFIEETTSLLWKAYAFVVIFAILYMIWGSIFEQYFEVPAAAMFFWSFIAIFLLKYRNQKHAEALKKEKMQMEFMCKVN